MAYVTQIMVRLCAWERCKRVATYEVRGQWNDLFGAYCKEHANARRQTIQANEDAERARLAVSDG